MAVTQSKYTADGNTTKYSITFEYLNESDVKVSLDGSNTTAFTLANATTINLNATPAAGVVVRIYRETDLNELNSEFFPGSAIRASDLNDNFNQALFTSQEVNDRYVDTNNPVFGADVSLGGFKIINLADGVAATDAATKSQVDATQNANDAALAAAVTNAQAAQTAAETAKTGAETAKTGAETASTSSSGFATTAEGHAADAAASAASASASAGAAANFSADPVFIGIRRNVAGGRTALRVDFSEATNTTNTYNPDTYNYKNTGTCMLTTNGILHTTTSGGTVGEPKIAFATATDASRTSGHVYIQLHN